MDVPEQGMLSISVTIYKKPLSLLFKLRSRLITMVVLGWDAFGRLSPCQTHPAKVLANPGRRSDFGYCQLVLPLHGQLAPGVEHVALLTLGDNMQGCQDGRVACLRQKDASV